MFIKGLDLAIKRGLNANLILAGELDQKVLINCKKIPEKLTLAKDFHIWKIFSKMRHQFIKKEMTYNAEV